MGRKKKTVLEKVVEAVDHVIHPEHAEQASNEEAQEMVDKGEAEIPAEAVVAQSSSVQSDLAKHPKFAKFKSQGNIQGEKQHD